MLSKLILNKYEKGQDVQSMEILFHEEYINTIKTIVKTIYSPWVTGTNTPKEKNPKLVIHNYKGDSNFEGLNLDLVSKRIPFHNQNQTDLLDVDKAIIQHENNEASSPGEVADFHLQNIDRLSSIFTDNKIKKKSKIKIDDISDILTKRAKISETNTNDALTTAHVNTHQLLSKTFHPFHQKLEIIRKNNEKIMENIQKLNKLLDYTKNKEIETSVIESHAVYFVCDKCGKSFNKNSSFQYHLRQHKNEEDHYLILSEPESADLQAFLVCPYCSQVWFEDSFFIAHLEECNGCAAHNAVLDSFNVKNIITNACKANIFLMQCEFCEKIFATVKKLMSHQNGHRTNKNYECSYCSLVFIGYKYLTEHWEKECRWIQYASSFNFKKSLICNVCYENFDDHESLYTHRYEYRHFIIKCNITSKTTSQSNTKTNFEHTVSNEENLNKSIIKGDKSNTPDISNYKRNINLEIAQIDGDEGTYNNEYIGRKDSLLYQCELCGFLVKSVANLIMHRDEEHSQLLCQMCGEISKSKESFDSHVKMHSDVSEESKITEV